MICPNCKTKYYSKTSCPNCGQEAFAINRGRRAPSASSYKQINRITIAAFFIVILIALTFFKFAEKDEVISAGGSDYPIDYPRVSLIKIVEDEEAEPVADVLADSPDESAAYDEVTELNSEGITAYRAKDYDRAFVYFYQAYSLDSSNDAIERNLYNTLTAKGYGALKDELFDEAVINFNKSLLYVDDDYNAYQGLGLAYSGLSDNDNALKQLLAAYELNNENDSLKHNISRLYNNMGDRANALKFMDRIEEKSEFSYDLNVYSMATKATPKEVEDKVGTESANFSVYYDGYKNPVAGNLVSQILEESYYSVGEELGYYPEEKVTAILYTDEQFNEDIGHPDWSDAFFDGKIKLPAGGLKDRSERLTEILTHEYTHAVIFHKVKTNCPDWLNEGLAQILSGQSEPPESRISAIVMNNKLPELSTLEQRFSRMSSEEAYLAYNISMLYTQHLINTYGMDSIRRLLDKLSEGTDPKDAFSEAYYIEAETSYDKFVEELKSEYK